MHRPSLSSWLDAPGMDCFFEHAERRLMHPLLQMLQFMMMN